MRTFVLSLAVGWLIANTAIAGEACKAPAACTEVQTCGSPDRCGRCGCCCPCEKYCRVVCEMKEVKKTCWVVKCEDFCAPLPGCSRGCCEGCEGRRDLRAEAGCSNECGRKCDPCARKRSKCYRSAQVRQGAGEEDAGEEGNRLPGAELQVRRGLLLPKLRSGPRVRRPADASASPRSRPTGNASGPRPRLRARERNRP